MASFATFSTSPAQVTSLSLAARPLHWVPRGPGIQSWDPFGVGASTNAKYLADPFDKGRGSRWSDMMPPSRRELIRSTGFRFIRLPIDLGALTTAPTEAILSDRISKYLSAVIDLVASGLQVIVCPAPSSQIGPANVPGWGNGEIFDGVRGTKWSRVTAVSQVLAESVGNLAKPSEVAYELLNEPAFTFQMPNMGLTFAQHIAALRDVVRAGAPTTTIIIPSSGFQSIDLRDGLIAFDRSMFPDQNMYVGFHFFPGCWAAQGAGFYRHLHRVPYPPKSVDRARVFADFIAAVTADDALTPAQRAQEVSYFLLEHNVDGLDTYYDQPQDDAWFRDDRMAKVLSWAAAKEMTGRVICTEWSVNGDRTAPIVSLAADETSRVNGMRAMRQALEAADIPWCFNELTNPQFGQGLADNQSFAFNETLIQALALKGAAELCGPGARCAQGLP